MSSCCNIFSCCSRLFFNNIAFSGSECLNKFTDVEGIPVIVDTVCIPSSFEQCVQLACPAGRIVVIGLKNQPSAIIMADITKKELTIVGSRLNNNCFD
ncbi:MAG: zinc-binding dehydrogenase [Oliverpabstia sp.]|nr:zinc-binding dehydrogenase [Oliverpabstia sp.]